MKKAVIILSGGMDSGVLLATVCRAYNQIHALTFDYGAKHSHKEIPMAVELAKLYAASHKVIDIRFLDRILNSSLLSSGDEIPDGTYNTVNMASTVVPFRNGIMLSIGVGYAESIGAAQVLIGSHSGDHPIYPDCTPEFTDAFSKAAEFGTSNSITVSAPFSGLTKYQIAERGRAIHFDFLLTWTCYKGREKHCGVCAACNERKIALLFNDGKDPTAYEL